MRDAGSLERLETPRLVLRCWDPADAPSLKDAIDTSLEELRPWMPWAMSEPSPVELLAQRLAGSRRDFFAGHEWIYGLFDPTETRVLGGMGLHPRGGADTLEIGYWLRRDATHRGLATEAVGALLRLAFETHGVKRVEIRCDPNNLRSAAIPQRLGFRHLVTLESDSVTPAGAPRDTMVWTLERS